MGFLTERRALPTNIDVNQVTARPAFPNYSGEAVTEDNMFTASAVTACVTIIADSLATMPLERVRRSNGIVTPLELPPIFIKPNDEQLMFEFVHQLAATCAIFGSAFIYAPRNNRGDVIELRNLSPRLMTVTYENGERVYRYNRTRFDNSEIIQIDWLRLPNRLRSVSPLEAMRNQIGMNLAIDRFLSQFYGEGATPSSVLETDSTLTTEQAKMVRDQWEDAHYKHRRPAVLVGGLRWRSITASASDMDTMNLRDSIIRDIARVYRIPLHLVLGTGGDNQTYQNVESAGINFVRHTLLPWMRRIEVALSQVLPYPEHVRFNADEFQRADLSTRVKAYQTQIATGILSPNEARHLEGREPYEGGDNFIIASPGAQVVGMDAITPQMSLGNDQ